MKHQIAYITDLHLEEQFPKDQGVDCQKNWEQILQDVTSRGIDHIIIGGDIGEYSVNKIFFQSLNTFQVDVSPGNHDSSSEIVKHFNPGILNSQEKLYYRKDYNPYTFLFLDSSLGVIDPEQLLWLEKQLASAQKAIICIHHPIIEVPTEVDRLYSLLNRDQVQQVLQNSQKEITLFSGHYHLDDERTIGLIRQYVSPASSFQVAKLPDDIQIDTNSFGYRILTLQESEIQTEVILF
ncbi:metallophosphoesterase family protein [Pseudotenacibaculum haliotis]|uniref:Metallophosphoesterase family protein n=1 Tax=Pseudotenacibaculum haliotis TaxID=1862138 RepID=A0ABW5LNS8_9FLAO